MDNALEWILNEIRVIHCPVTPVVSDHSVPSRIPTPYALDTYPWIEILQLASRAGLEDIIAKVSVLLVDVVNAADSRNRAEGAKALDWAYAVAVQGEALGPRRTLECMLVMRCVMPKVSEVEADRLRDGMAVMKLYATWLRGHLFDRRQCPFKWLVTFRDGKERTNRPCCIARLPADFWADMYESLRRRCLTGPHTNVYTASWDFPTQVKMMKDLAASALSRGTRVGVSGRRHRLGSCACVDKLLKAVSWLHLCFENSLDKALLPPMFKDGCIVSNSLEDVEEDLEKGEYLTVRYTM